MRVIRLALAVLTLSFVAVGLGAQNPAPSFNLAVVDFQRALNSVEEGKAAMKEIEDEGKKRQDGLTKKQKELEELQGKLEEFQRNASTGMMAPEAMAQGRKLQEDFRLKFEAYQKELQDADQAIQTKEMDARRVILGKLRELVNQLGRTEAFSLVLEANESGLLYAASYTDLTEKVIQEYNKKHKVASKGRR
jgi:outer membrane protein